MKTIFISSFHPFISRNVLNTDIFKILRSNTDLKIIILVPEEKKQFFVQYYSAGNVIIEGFNQKPIRTSRFNKFFHNAAFLLIKTHYTYYTKWDRLKVNPTLVGRIKFLIENILTNILAGHKWANKLFRLFDNLLTAANFYQLYFDKYKPAAVFATDIYNDYDQLLIKESKTRLVPVVGMIRSWDNNYSKGLCRFLPDKLIVNNETIKKEAVMMHNFRPENIFIGGIPQFDDYLKAPFLSREEFFQKIDGDPAKKMVLVSPAGFPLVSLEEDINMCQILKEAQDRGDISQAVQFLIRSHPHRPVLIQGFEGVKNFIIESHSTTSKTQGKGAEFTLQDKLHLVDSIYYADVVIWAATSLGIDSLAMNKPQILINFDGLKKKDYWDSVRRFHA